MAYTFSRAAGPLLLAACAAALIAQVLVRPAVGIANNGDFPKMAGVIALGPERGDWTSYEQYSQFLYRYIRDDRYRYNSGFGAAEFLSSEFFFVKAARGLQRVFEPGPRFDIRWLGGLHAVFFLAAIGIWLYALAPQWRPYAGLLVVLIWTDVAYVQYLNSFYMDTAGMIFLVACVASGLRAAQDLNHRMFALVTISAAVLFAVSKSQHVIPAMLFVPLFLAFAIWSSKRAARVVWAAGCVALMIGGAIVFGRDSRQQRSVPVFNMVFTRVAPGAPDPLHALQELGLGSNDAPLLHTHAYTPDSPINDAEWARQFASRCNYATLLRYYIRHPAVPAHILYEDIAGQASHIRPWANLSPEDGFPPGAQAAHFTWWSDLRAFLLRHAPWHLILLALGTAAGGVWLLVRSPANRPFAALVLTVQALAVAEYGIAVLADALETDRHLMLFHVATESTILLLPLLIAKITSNSRAESTSPSLRESTSPSRRSA